MMARLRAAFDFFIFSNIFIACCAVLMVWQTTYLLPNTVFNPDLALFVFFATICSYNFHWWLTPLYEGNSSRLSWLEANRRLHFLLFGIGLLLSFYFGYQLIEYWPCLTLGALIAFLYSAPMIPHPFFRMLRRIALGKTVFLSFAWAYITAAIPILASTTDWTLINSLYFLNQFFLVYSICIIFDFRDRDYDISIGIRSLVTKLDKKGIDLLFSLSVILTLVTAVLLPFWELRTWQIGILPLPVLITASLYKKAVSARNDDMLFYFLLDGLMALSALVFLLIELVADNNFASLFVNNFLFFN